MLQRIFLSKTHCFLTWIICLFCLSGCREKSPLLKEEFNVLMGEGASVWEHIQLDEDHQNLSFYKTLYEHNKHLLALRGEDIKIPRVMHFIWLGPVSFPKDSIKHVRSWISCHPGWTYKFWTDKKRRLPDPNMELHLVSDFEFQHLKHCYESSDNFAEKSDLLRYEILLAEGGLYIDHDVMCFRSLESLHSSFDLYCGLEPPHPPILDSSITVCNNLIGAKPGHPVLKQCIDLVQKRWTEGMKAYPGEDSDSVIYRVAYRSFAPFDQAVQLYNNQQGNFDMIFPAAYFNKIGGRFGLIAHHEYASTWFGGETKFERLVRRRLDGIAKKNNQILLLNGLILLGNLILFGCLLSFFCFIRRKKKSWQPPC